MKYVRERILEPIILPLVAVAVIAFGALNLSRVFLASASAGRAVLVATAIAATILAVSAWASSREHIDRGVLFGGAALFGLVLSGAGVLAQQVDADHVRDEGGGEVEVVSSIPITASNFAFEPPSADAAGPGIEVAYTSAEGSHTFVVEGHETDLKLAAGAGKTVTGVIELEPGDYTFYCDLPGHRDAGMEGSLTVTEGGGSAAGAESAPEAAEH